LGLSEADTRVKLIDPKLRASGWNEDMISREVLVTKGAIIDSEGNRKPPKFADYVLYHGGMAIAIIEAKEEDMDHLSGMKQAKEYCKMWDALFAYSSNGHKIEEFDFITMKQRTSDGFPTPDELYDRFIVGRFGSIRNDPISQPFYSGVVSLRYYQDAAVKKIIEAFLNGQKKILIAMATGSGKTKVAFQTVWKLYNSKNIQKILFITDRNFLVANATGEFEPFKDAVDVIENQKTPMNRDILFATYQSLYGADSKDRPYKRYDHNYW
jgi:type I restriction enzyme, R subunit